MPRSLFTIFLSLLEVQLKQDFSVGVGPKPGSITLKAVSQLFKVIDFTIEHDADT
jgi:hypothetical protein